VAAAALCTAVLAGCTPATGTTSPSSPPATPTASATPSAVLDLAEPGVARTMVRRLVAASGSSQVLLVDIRRHEASVSVLNDGKPHTWAYREGEIREISSDLAYVDQAIFDPDAFDLSDVGALFRAAAAVSGSEQSQELQIVDQRRVEHSARDLKMSVATNPETRTVFFNPDGTLVPTLDFNTAGGITVGLVDAVGAHTSVTGVTIGSATGAFIEYPLDAGTVVRRSRSAKIPVIDVPRSAGGDRPTAFDPRLVDAAVIWRVLQRYAATGAFGPTSTWSVVADVRGTTTQPRLRFTVGQARVVTDLAGNEISE
jgi:hypothetical protein